LPQRHLDAVTMHDRFVKARLDQVPVRRISLLIEGGAQRADHELFDIRSGNPSNGSGLVPPALK
jgi:hypothetical protein